MSCNDCNITEQYYIAAAVVSQSLVLPSYKCTSPVMSFTRGKQLPMNGNTIDCYVRIGIIIPGYIYLC